MKEQKRNVLVKHFNETFFSLFFSKTLKPVGIGIFSHWNYGPPHHAGS